MTVGLLVVPANNTTMEAEMNALCPHLAPFLVARVKRPARTLTVEDLPDYRRSTLEAIEPFLADKPDLERVIPAVEAMVARIQQYVPGYQLLVKPRMETNRIVTMVKVQGAGDYLPRYAGNLDIINCAALAAAEAFASRRYSSPAPSRDSRHE